MEEIKKQITALLEEENKEACYQYVMGKLAAGEIDVMTLYGEILTPILNTWQCSLDDKNICIWKEHVRTAIVRTIVESCYPYVIRMRDQRNTPKKATAVVICPPEEYHDLGARMVADIFTILGCNSVFVGQNTPYEDFYNAIHGIRPQFVAISVSNYYNLVATRKIIDELRLTVDYPITIMVGGGAFYLDPEKYKKVGADYLSTSFEDIEKIIEKGVKADETGI